MTPIRLHSRICWLTYIKLAERMSSDFMEVLAHSPFGTFRRSSTPCDDSSSTPGFWLPWSSCHLWLPLKRGTTASGLVRPAGLAGPGSVARVVWADHQGRRGLARPASAHPVGSVRVASGHPDWEAREPVAWALAGWEPEVLVQRARDRTKLADSSAVTTTRIFSAATLRIRVEQWE